MNPKKMNSTLWYSLGLVLLLCIAIPVLATGTAFARYRTDEEHQANFRVEEAAKVYMGKITFVEKEGEPTDEVESFDSNAEILWEDGDGAKTLTFHVANGENESKAYAKDQRFRIRVIAGPNAFEEGKEVPICIVFPPEEGSETERTIEATPKAIGTGTDLYMENGSGWIFTFFDGNGNEIYWDLPGKKFSYAEITLRADVSGTEGDIIFNVEIEPEVMS